MYSIIYSDLAKCLRALAVLGEKELLPENVSASDVREALANALEVTDDQDGGDDDIADNDADDVPLDRSAIVNDCVRALLKEAMNKPNLVWILRLFHERARGRDLDTNEIYQAALKDGVFPDCKNFEEVRTQVRSAMLGYLAKAISKARDEDGNGYDRPSSGWLRQILTITRDETGSTTYRLDVDGEQVLSQLFSAQAAAPEEATEGVA